MKTKEEIEQLAEKEYREYPNNPLDEPAWHYNKDIHCNKKRKAFIKGYTQCQEDINKEPSRNFYLRLKNFVSNVKVNDMMSEEEKEMIISVCDKQINKQN